MTHDTLLVHQCNGSYRNVEKLARYLCRRFGKVDVLCDAPPEAVQQELRDTHYYGLLIVDIAHYENSNSIEVYVSISPTVTQYIADTEIEDNDVDVHILTMKDIYSVVKEITS